MYVEKFGVIKRRLKSEDYTYNSNNKTNVNNVNGNMKYNNNCIGDFILGTL